MRMDTDSPEAYRNRVSELNALAGTAKDIRGRMAELKKLKNGEPVPPGLLTKPFPICRLVWDTPGNYCLLAQDVCNQSHCECPDLIENAVNAATPQDAVSALRDLLEPLHAEINKLAMALDYT